MSKIHIALTVADVTRSIEDYSWRLGCQPAVVVPDEYALWRTDSVNFSIARSAGASGTLSHLGWEDPSASRVTVEVDVNGVVWERFSAHLQLQQIRDTWPTAPSAILERDR